MCGANMQEGYPEVSEADVRFLAQLHGLKIDDADLAEVTFRVRAMLTAITQLQKMDLGGLEPIPVIPPKREE